jgi:hypothetical protein
MAPPPWLHGVCSTPQRPPLANAQRPTEPFMTVSHTPGRRHRAGPTAPNWAGRSQRRAAAKSCPWARCVALAVGRPQRDVNGAAVDAPSHEGRVSGQRTMHRVVCQLQAKDVVRSGCGCGTHLSRKPRNGGSRRLAMGSRIARARIARACITRSHWALALGARIGRSHRALALGRSRELP